MRNRIRYIGPVVGSVALLGVLTTGCAEPSEEFEALGARHLALTSTTITFDESGLPPGSDVTDEFQAQGVIFSAPPGGLVWLAGASAHAWPTASGANYLAVNTTPAVPPGTVVTATFIDACGAPATTDSLSLYAVDANPSPDPRVAVRTFDAGGSFLEERLLSGTDTALLTFMLGGIARAEFDDLGGDGHLIDDISIAIDDNDPDDDLMCGDADNCPDVANDGQSDLDGDGVGDACDVCPNDAANDADGDGLCGDADPCPTTVACADLKVEISSSLLLTYAVAVRNLGVDSATSVQLQVDLPTGVVLSTYEGSGWSCGVTAGDLSCSRPALAAGADAPKLTLVVVPLSLPSTLSATVSSATGDPNPANNSASVTLPGQ